MRPLFESNMSRFLSTNMRDPQFKLACQALLKKGYDIARIPDSAIKKMTPQDAFKLEGKRGDLYFKFWFVGNQFAFCTWANTMIDKFFRWKQNERGTCIGDPFWVRNYRESNDTINDLSACYVVAYADMPQVGEIRTNRKEAKTGATALMTDEQIRNLNLKCYQKKLVETGFSDGQEAAMVQRTVDLFIRVFLGKFVPILAVYDSAKSMYRDMQRCFERIEDYMQYANDCKFDISLADKSEIDYLSRKIIRDNKTLEDRIKSSQEDKELIAIDKFIKNVRVNTKAYDVFVGSIEDAALKQMLINVRLFVLDFSPKVEAIIKNFGKRREYTIGQMNDITEVLIMYCYSTEQIFRMCDIANRYWEEYKKSGTIEEIGGRSIPMSTEREYNTLINKLNVFNRSLMAIL